MKAKTVKAKTVKAKAKKNVQEKSSEMQIETIKESENMGSSDDDQVIIYCEYHTSVIILRKKVLTLNFSANKKIPKAKIKSILG